MAYLLDKSEKVYKYFDYNAGQSVATILSGSTDDMKTDNQETFLLVSGDFQITSTGNTKITGIDIKGEFVDGQTYELYTYGPTGGQYTLIGSFVGTGAYQEISKVIANWETSCRYVVEDPAETFTYHSKIDIYPTTPDGNALSKIYFMAFVDFINDLITEEDVDTKIAAATLAGTSGVDGAAGTSGVDGAAGAAGTSGVDGTSGTSGAGIDVTIADKAILYNSAGTLTGDTSLKYLSSNGFIAGTNSSITAFSTLKTNSFALGASNVITSDGVGVETNSGALGVGNNVKSSGTISIGWSNDSNFYAYGEGDNVGYAGNSVMIGQYNWINANYKNSIYILGSHNRTKDQSLVTILGSYNDPFASSGMTGENSGDTKVILAAGLSDGDRLNAVEVSYNYTKINNTVLLTDVVTGDKYGLVMSGGTLTTYLI